MPTDLISFTMQDSSLSGVQNLTVTVTFQNGSVTLSNGGATGVYWGTPQTNDPRQWYTFAANSVQFTGNMVNFYCEFWMDCQTSPLTGTITASQPLPVKVSLGSYGGGEHVALPAGQTSVKFSLPVANYGASAGSGLLAKELKKPTA